MPNRVVLPSRRISGCFMQRLFASGEVIFIMPVETLSTIDIEDEDIDLEEELPTEFEDSFEPEHKEDSEEPDALGEVIAQFGGDPKEWDKTHDDPPLMVFRDGKLWNEDDNERSITEKIEEECTPEQIALHHSINETWSREPEKIQLVDFKEEIEGGHILHVSALWLEDGRVASETWSREVKEEQEQF